MDDDDYTRPYERSTQQLNNRSAIGDMNDLRKIMLFCRDKKLQQAQTFIQELLERKNSTDKKQFYPQALQNELEYLRLIFNTMRREKPINLQANKQLLDIYKQRLVIFNINMKLKIGLPVQDVQILQLVALAEQENRLKQQFLQKLIGCRSVSRLKQISKQEIDDLTQDQQKKAIKYQLAADWKFIVGLNDQALEMKKLAVEAWNSCANKNRKKLAQKQLSQLTKLCKSEEILTKYTLKLTTIKKIVQYLQKVPDTNQIQRLKANIKKSALLIYLPYTISHLQVQEIQTEKSRSKSKGKKQLSKSQSKQKGIVEVRKQISKLFMQENKKNNFVYFDFMPENRFCEDGRKQFEKNMGIFNRLCRKRYREMIDYLKSTKKDKQPQNLMQKSPKKSMSNNSPTLFQKKTFNVQDLQDGQSVDDSV